VILSAAVFVFVVVLLCEILNQFVANTFISIRKFHGIYTELSSHHWDCNSKGFMIL